MKKKGRPRGAPKDHHLKLEGNIWIFRLLRDGRDVRRSTGCPKSEVAAARVIRDKWLGESASRRQGIEELPSVVTVGKLIDLYLAAESRPYDRERGGEQPGAKRGAAGDRGIVIRLRKYLDFALPADRLDRERLLDAAAGIVAAGRVVQTKKGPKRVGEIAGFTVRNTFRFLRRVYGWGMSNPRKAGAITSPFAALQRVESKRLFPGKVTKRAPPFKREELRALCELLPAHAVRPVRFDAHTAMRFQSEVLQMVWGRVDFAGRVYAVDPRWAKKGKARDVALSDVAIAILRNLREALPKEPAATDPVWLNADGLPLKDIRRGFRAAVKKVCPEPGPGLRRPDFHSLRRTCATALAKIAPKAVVRSILGHGPEDVTDLYIDVTVEDQIAALNRAALLIDGNPEENVVALTRPEMAVKMAVGLR